MRLMLAIGLILTSTCLSFAQRPSKPFDLQHYLLQIPVEIVEVCNTAKNVAGMSVQEKDVVLLTNIVRTNPQLFLKVFMDDYIRTSEFYDSDNSYVISLKRDLEKAKPLPPLKVEKVINETSLTHAAYCGSSGHIGHKNFPQRSNVIMKKLKHDLVGENCSYIRTHALDFVMDLLIDDGIPNLGHRKNIFSKQFQFTGVAIQPFKDGESCLVQMFSGTIIVK